MSVILIIEDNRDLVLSLEAHLRRTGHEIVSAFDGVEGLEKLDATPATELVLLDVMMPRMDGYQVLTRLRSGDRWRDLPVIVLSAFGDSDQVVRGLSLGANDFLVKPFDFGELIARVSTQLRIRQLERELRDAEKMKLLLDAAHASAHELSQPATTILARLELCRARLPAKSAIRKDLDVINEEANKISAIIRKLQAVKSYHTKEYKGVGTLLDFDELPEPPAATAT